MLDNLSILDAEDIDGGLAAVFVIERDVIVDEDEITVRTDVLDLRLALREFLKEDFNAILEGLTAILEARIMLNIVGGCHLVDHSRIMLVEYFIPEGSL